MKLFILCTVFLATFSMGLIEAADPASCVQKPLVFNYDMMIDQFAFLQSMESSFTETQALEIVAELKNGSTINNPDDTNLRPAVFGFNGHVMDHLMEMRENVRNTLYHFLVKEYQESLSTMDCVIDKASRFQHSVNTYFPK